MNTLAAYNLSALSDGNPFAGKGTNDPIADGEQISLDTNTCLAQANCDQIAKSPQSGGTGSNYITLGWNHQLPPAHQCLLQSMEIATLDDLKGCVDHT